MSILLRDIAGLSATEEQAGVVRDPLAAQARRFISRRLSSGAWKPGDRITIRSLAKELGISTTPVREVLLQLVSSGCLELKQNTAFSVPHMSLDIYLETRRLRVLLEGEAAAVAACRTTPSEIQNLADIHAQLEAAERRNDIPRALEWNRAFHLTLVDLSRLRTLATFVETLWLRSGPLLNAIYPRVTSWQQGVYRHDVVLAGLRERDPDKARAAIQDDIVAGARQVEATLRG